MLLKIKNDNKIMPSLDFVLSRLPDNIQEGITQFVQKNPYIINEIRMRANSYISLIASSINVKTDIYTNENDIQKSLLCLCDNSLYAHIDTIKDGYISIGKGIRAGISGRALCANGIIEGVCDITSINIRIPYTIKNASDYLYNLLHESSFRKSVILYSAPGVGKTTILRDLILKLSRTTPIIRYSIIDSRNEITSFIEDEITGDVFLSYPKGRGIEMATKSMTPQLIICDEISSTEDAEAILSAVNCGVKLIATTHADSFLELCEKKILKNLLKNNVFDYALGVCREYGESVYHFSFNKLGDFSENCR